MARKSELTASVHYFSALNMLEITEEDLEDVAKIDDLFNEIGGREKAFEYLAFCEEPDALKIFQLRRRLDPDQRQQLPLEAYAVAAGITPKRLFCMISGEIMERSMKMSAMLAKLHHPEVVQQTIAVAMTKNGYKDREALHKAVGFLPTPKNSFTVVHGDQNINRTRLKVTVLPTLEEVARDLSSRFIDAVPTRTLPAAPPPEEEEEE